MTRKPTDEVGRHEGSFLNAGRLGPFSRRVLLRRAAWFALGWPLLAGAGLRPNLVLAATAEVVETEDNMEGPYYKPGAPIRSVLLESGMKGTPLTITGRVLDIQGRALRGALLDIWQADANGAYDNQAMAEGNQERFEALLAQAGSDAKPVTTTRLVNGAAYFGWEKMLEALLAKGADFRAVDSDGWTALHCAALGGHPHIVARMLVVGLGVNDRIRSDGMTALALGAVRAHSDVVQLLLAHHVQGQSALSLAALAGHGQISKLLAKSKPQERP